jgi:uncharacterized protein YecE (DUF72 family)
LECSTKKAPLNDMSDAATTVGPSGWRYDDWRGRVYPDGLPPERWLAWTAERFDAVEVNNTFYQQVDPHVLDRWRESVPDGFTFALKANRYVTHQKNLKEPEDTLPPLYRRAERLGEALGPILFQCPPHWHCNPERLEGFLDALSDDHRHAFEFRHPSWLVDPVLEALDRQGAALCLADWGPDPMRDEAPVSVDPARPGDLSVPGDHVYVRLHGPETDYAGAYDGDRLCAWARRLRGWEAEGVPAFVFFNNTRGAAAVADARRLRRMIQGDSDTAESRQPLP